MDTEKKLCRTCADANLSEPFWDGFKCVPCSKSIGGEYFDGQKCVIECPDDKPFADEHKICWACVDIDVNTPLWKGGKCQACSEGEYF